MSEQRTQRPQVVGVPLESVKAGPHWVPEPERAASQPLLGAPRPLMASARAVPLDGGSGRIPEGGGNASMKQRSVFEGPRGPGAQINEVRLTGTGPRLQQLQVSQAAHGGAPPMPPPEYRRTIGQAVPAVQPAQEVEIERIIERQLPPQGMSKNEAQQLANALSTAIDVTQQAITAGEKCFGVDDASIADAKASRDYLVNFVSTAADADRTSPSRLPKEKLDIVEKILECQMAHERLQAQNAPSILGLIVAGAIIAGVGYFLVKDL